MENARQQTRNGRIQRAHGIGFRRLAFFPAANSPGYYNVINGQYSACIPRVKERSFEAIGIALDAAVFGPSRNQAADFDRCFYRNGAKCQVSAFLYRQGPQSVGVPVGEVNSYPSKQ